MLINSVTLADGELKRQNDEGAELTESSHMLRHIVAVDSSQRKSESRKSRLYDLSKAFGQEGDQWAYTSDLTLLHEDMLELIQFAVTEMTVVYYKELLRYDCFPNCVDCESVKICEWDGRCMILKLELLALEMSKSNHCIG